METSRAEDANRVRRVRKLASGVLLVRVAALALSFGINIVLTRTMGSDSFGVYALVMAWVSIAAIAGSLGFETSLPRYIAAYRETEKWGLLRGAIVHARRLALLATLALTPALAALAYILELGPAGTSLVFVAGFAQLPLAVLAKIQGAATRGLHRVVQGQAAELFVRPLTTAAVVIGILIFTGRPVAALEGMLGQWFAAAAELGASALFLRWALRAESQRAAIDRDLSATWNQSAFAALMATFLRIVQQRASVVVLGAFAQAEDVGLFHVASRCADLTVIGLTVLTASLAPTVAARHAVGDVAGVQAVVRDSVRTATLVSVVILAVLFLGAETWLSLFGAEFARAATALRLLCLGQVANAATGPVGTLLMATGHERVMSRVLMLGLAINVGLAACLAPRWGASGAALAAAVSTIVWNVCAAIAARKLIGVDGSILSVLRARE